MPKPLKNTGRLPVPPKPKRARDPNRVADDIIADRLGRVQEPAKAADQPMIDPRTVISEHMRKLGAKGGKISGAKRIENLTDSERRAIALKAARARWGNRKKSG